VEGKAEPQHGAQHSEQFLPEVASEDGIPIADNGVWNAMEVHHLIKERLCHRQCYIRMMQHDEVCVFGETVDHDHNHHLATHLRKTLDKIHGSVSPNKVRNVEGLEEVGRMQAISFVLLANRAAPDEVVHHLVIIGHEDGCAEQCQCLLYSFMSCAMRQCQDLRPKC
jgi:hypothetical protein